jgi:Na+/phosphate symporter
MKKNKKQINRYIEDFNFALDNLSNEISRYLEVAENDEVSHNDITRTIALINWTARTVSENRDDLEIKIMAKS